MKGYYRSLRRITIKVPEDTQIFEHCRGVAKFPKPVVRIITRPHGETIRDVRISKMSKTTNQIITDDILPKESFVEVCYCVWNYGDKSSPWNCESSIKKGVKNAAQLIR